MEDEEGRGSVECCWAGLPEELSLAVLAFLDVPSLARFAEASRACYRLSLDPSLWYMRPLPPSSLGWPSHDACVAACGGCDVTCDTQEGNV
jgi:hypothetical protein